MGFLCQTPTPSTVPTVSQAETQLPSWYQEALRSMDVQASEIANQPYQPYGGTRLAGFSPDQLNAYDVTRQNLGSYIPGLSSAYNAANMGTQSVLGNIQNYMNPYAQNVIDINKREAVTDYQKQQLQRNANAVQAGAFGNTRFGIENSEAARNLNEQLQDIQNKGLSDAFTQAGQLFNADANRQLQGANIYSDLGTATQSAGLRDAAALEAIGLSQQQQQQKSLDLAYQDFAEQRDYTKNQASWLNSILRGQQLPTTTTTTSQNLVQQQSPLAQIAGAGMTAYGLLDLLGKARGGRIRKRRRY